MQRRAIRVTGVVQGVGFRPFVSGLAAELSLSGHVGNDADGVFIEVQGDETALRDFETRLRTEAPPMSVVDEITGSDIELHTEDSFVILASVESEGTTSIPPDTAACDACLAEMRDPDDRRFGYPFIACTNCGPRYTIVTGLPYDRPFTTMADFPMCESCQAEYDDLRSRRFHAQPTACPSAVPHCRCRCSRLSSACASGKSSPSRESADITSPAMPVTQLRSLGCGSASSAAVSPSR